MKILYLSCHEILEFDEVSLLYELGHEVFSPGAYVCPDNKGDNDLRPSVPGLVYSEDIMKQWHQMAAAHPGKDTKDYLTKSFIDNFDIVIVMHLPRWIKRNWGVMAHKPVIWRTIGQSIAGTEKEMAPYRGGGMKIVRYSPMENNIPGFIGSDALIRFYKDPDTYNGWTGKTSRIITFAQHMKQRAEACNFNTFCHATQGYNRTLFGPGNEDTLPEEQSKGRLTWENQLEEYRKNRCYFYTGTHPASYTLNFMEAWMTGIPIVAIGGKFGNASYFQGHNLYEIPDLITNYYNGFVTDSIPELRKYIKELLTNHELAQMIGGNGRKTAIEIFGKETIKQQWKSYLEKFNG